MNSGASFLSEVLRQIGQGSYPFVVIYVGRSALVAAEVHRIRHGSGTALALGPNQNPNHTEWPALVDPVIHDAGASQQLLLETAEAIARAGASSVIVRSSHEYGIPVGVGRAA